MTMNYMQTYTQLRTGKLSFDEFMNFLDEVHCTGIRRGVQLCNGPDEKKGAAGKQQAKVAYEAIF